MNLKTVFMSYIRKIRNKTDNKNNNKNKNQNKGKVLIIGVIVGYTILVHVSFSLFGGELKENKNNKINEEGLRAQVINKTLTEDITKTKYKNNIKTELIRNTNTDKKAKAEELDTKEDKQEYKVEETLNNKYLKELGGENVKVLKEEDSKGKVYYSYNVILEKKKTNTMLKNSLDLNIAYFLVKLKEGNQLGELGEEVHINYLLKTYDKYGYDTIIPILETVVETEEIGKLNVDNVLPISENIEELSKSYNVHFETK